MAEAKRRVVHGDYAAGGQLQHLQSGLLGGSLQGVASQINDAVEVIAVYDALGNVHNVILTPPLDYPELVYIMKHAKLVMTDSGGIQEEAPTFGTPVLVMRYETERREGVDAGFARLVGADPDKILGAARVVLSRTKSETMINGRKNPYGDGHAAEKIANAIMGQQS